MLTIGLMTGTSLDGADAVAMRFPSGGRPVRIGSSSVDMPEALGRELRALATGTDNEIERMGDASVALARLYARVTEKLIAETGIERDQVAALGVHGQTIRHRPERGFTIQLNHPALLAEMTGIPVIADFRSRDVAAGGEGAPLVPAFHARIFTGDEPVAVLNLGGIANLTLLPPHGADEGASPVLGFDTGPGNTLLDHWMLSRTGVPCDRFGLTASKGRVDEELLARMLEDPYFSAPPPKSTGRERFSPAWLTEKLVVPARYSTEDVAATLTELTARTVTDALARFQKGCTMVYTCGGGTLNPFLVSRLRHNLRARTHVRSVLDTRAFGLDPMEVEGAAFAWLAHRYLNGLAGNLPAVTHAAGPRILGALYPA
ncbi:anhydro-N-acetylmuramic acid kinase [Sutterella sp.]|uniref:anhydro-N-acetylmuramic acid kinase n=1 Tax=Sutterella sp. TaxID=1981025 RepID=UPI0026E01381|nr:anhydro-N-acetylmuramic acid kinase [Sutterella sp.]MDO5532554.1 anhydro-N-acetylmuramic acid kinase [Sutterella sp.]